MIEQLGERAAAAAGARVLVAYEASGQGFGLYDELTEAGIECHVLAPTRIARSQRQASQKTDEKDAQQLLELLRGHVLAGNELPTVWIPDPATRDDRELVRMRLDVAEKITMTKSQIQSLLKRNHIRRDEAAGKGWTRLFRVWLHATLCESAASPLGARTRVALASLMRQLDFLEEEERRLDEGLNDLAGTTRYAAAVEEMTSLVRRRRADGLGVPDRAGRPRPLCQPPPVGRLLGPGAAELRKRRSHRPQRTYHPPRFQPSPQGALPGDLVAGPLRSGRETGLRADRSQESQEEKDRRRGVDATPGGAHVASRAGVSSRPSVATYDPGSGDDVGNETRGSGVKRHPVGISLASRERPGRSLPPLDPG